MGKEVYKPEYTTLGAAMAGPYATIGHNVSVTGLWGDLESNYGDVVEGGTIIDKRNVDHAVLVTGVVSGPMLNEDLPPRTRDRLFEGQSPATEDDKFGGLDSISMDLYLAIWRKVGARIGQRQGNVVAWEDGTVETIRPVDQRYPWQRAA